MQSLMDTFVRFAEISALGEGGSDDELAELERQLTEAEVDTAADLHAKALYLRRAHAIDPGQISARALTTLVAGVERLSALATRPVGAIG